jgi:prepilin-type N-terminal cleavage/methylation domain-containing protein
MPVQRTHRGFTMLELMTVITIIVLVLAMAVPVVRSIEGNRSVEAGYNRLSAALGHARQIALFNRAPAGVVFYKYGNGPENMAFVEQQKVVLGNSTFDDRYMEIIPGEEILTMPPGVAVQLLSAINPTMTGSPAPGVSERYLRAGIVMFDENGQLETTQYFVPAPPSTPPVIAELGYQLGISSTLLNGMNPAGPALYTSPAVCLYDDDSYRSQVEPTSGQSFAQIDDQGNSFDTTFYNSVSPSYFANLTSNNLPPVFPTYIQKEAEMTWLDQNGETLVIKPNDGSLLRNQ